MVGFSGLALLLYASLRSSPHLREAPLFPAAIGQWLDAHGNVRHLFGCAIATLLAGWAWLEDMSPRSWLKPVLLIVSMSTALEIAQVFLPRRHADIHDVIYSSGGAALGWLIGAAISRGIEG